MVATLQMSNVQVIESDDAPAVVVLVALTRPEPASLTTMPVTIPVAMTFQAEPTWEDAEWQ